MAEPRIFQIGLQRCGTTALAAFLERSGIACVHYDGGRLACAMRDNLAAGARPLEGYEHYRAFTNMDWTAGADWFDGFAEFRALDAAYGGLFILNTRPVEHWVRSVMAHEARRARRTPGHALARFGTEEPEAVAAGWRALRDAHHRRVCEALPPERLLVFDIETDPPERLCGFLGLPRVCARHWRRENPTLAPLGNALARAAPRSVKRAVPERARRALKTLLRARP